jgi:colanic acid biosynthesis glycosyl transferase WcaI
MRVRFGLLTQWFDPEPGPASLPGVLARGLVKRGHSVQVVTGFPNYPDGRIADGYSQSRKCDETAEGVDVRRVALYPSHDDSSVKRLINYASFAASSLASGLDPLNDVDALWVNYSPVTIGIPMFVQKGWRNTPLFLHVLDLWPDTLFASGFAREGVAGRSVQSAVNRWCKAMYQAAHTVGYISPGVGDVLASRGVQRRKLTYAPMWADESTFVPLAPTSNRGWGLMPDQVALVYAGTLGRAQGLHTLVEACARVSDPRFRCLIAGSGVEEASLRALASERGATNVQFLGRLDKSAIGDLIRAGDVHYVGLNDHPLAHMTMPSKLQAILASARPIIGSLLGDAARCVEQSKAGWVVEPSDVNGLVAAIRLACGAGRTDLARRGRSGRRYYESEFSEAVGVDRIAEHLVLAAGSRQGSP